MFRKVKVVICRERRSRGIFVFFSVFILSREERGTIGFLCPNAENSRYSLFKAALFVTCFLKLGDTVLCLWGSQ